jgi:hypothetical protein
LDFAVEKARLSRFASGLSWFRRTFPPHLPSWRSRFASGLSWFRRTFPPHLPSWRSRFASRAVVVQADVPSAPPFLEVAVRFQGCRGSGGRSLRTSLLGGRGSLQGCRGACWDTPCESMHEGAPNTLPDSQRFSREGFGEGTAPRRARRGVSRLVAQLWDVMIRVRCRLGG